MADVQHGQRDEGVKENMIFTKFITSLKENVSRKQTSMEECGAERMNNAPSEWYERMEGCIKQKVYWLIARLPALEI